MTVPVAAAAYTGSVYRTRGDFYAARPERKTSPEAEYGVHWHDAPGRLGPSWQVAYCQDTGEVYATQCGGLTEVLGWVQPDPDHRYEPGGDLNGPTYYGTLDRILEGWADPGTACWELSWIRSRLAAYLSELAG